ncbi:MAG: hypothetical protein ABSC11_02340 [Smithella sp.]
MSHFEDLVSQVAKSSGVKIIGLMRQVAKIKNGSGKDASDVLGFDYVIKDDAGTCYEYYAAEPPLIGMSHPMPIPCPLGIVAFNGYKITYKDAIALFKKANCGDHFTNMSLAWPLTHPETKEPFWHIRSNLGFDFVVGAISGQVGTEKEGNYKYFGPIVVKYMGPVVKYMGPQS